MKRGIIAFVALAFPASAQASWELVRGEDACGINAQYADDGETNILMIGHADGDYTLDISNKNWSVRPGAKYPLTLAFDKRFFTVDATGYVSSDGRGFRLGGGQDLGEAFASAVNLAVLKDEEKPTVVIAVKLTGSMAGMAKMRTCVNSVRREQEEKASEARALAKKREIIPADPFYDPKYASPLVSPGRWITNDDYPSRAMREGREGATGFSLTVDRFGAVTKCEIVASSGHADLDAETCAILKRRARFNSAPVGSADREYSSRITWSIPKQERDE